MRIVAGAHRGRRLEAPADRSVRPTGERVREALFDILAHNFEGPGGGPMPRGALVLDAFAGTGALGLEALSRGAAAVTFLELEAAAAALIARNLGALGESARGQVLRRDATRPGPAPARHQLALLDPPYRSGLAAPALAALAEAGWLAPDAVCVVEHDRREAVEAPTGFAAIDERRYGDTRITLLRLA